MDDPAWALRASQAREPDRKSTRLNSSHSQISYAAFCLKKRQQKCKRDIGGRVVRAREYQNFDPDTLERDLVPWDELVPRHCFCLVVMQSLDDRRVIARP